jgi:hypothetical protein
MDSGKMDVFAISYMFFFAVVVTDTSVSATTHAIPLPLHQRRP